MFFSRLRRAFKAASNWNKALDCAVSGDAQSGLMFLDQIQVAGNLAFEVQLLRAEFLGEVNKLQDCYDLCLALLDEIPDNQSLDDNLKNYVTAFLLSIANRARARGPFDKSKPVSKIEKVAWEEIDLSSIRKKWKLNFPLNAHPDWK